MNDCLDVAVIDTPKNAYITLLTSVTVFFNNIECNSGGIFKQWKKIQQKVMKLLLVYSGRIWCTSFWYTWHLRGAERFGMGGKTSWNHDITVLPQDTFQLLAWVKYFVRSLRECDLDICCSQWLCTLLYECINLCLSLLLNHSHSCSFFSFIYIYIYIKFNKTILAPMYWLRVFLILPRFLFLNITFHIRSHAGRL